MFLLIEGSEPVKIATSVWTAKARVSVKIETVSKPPILVVAWLSPLRLKEGIGKPKLSIERSLFPRFQGDYENSFYDFLLCLLTNLFIIFPKNN